MLVVVVVVVVVVEVALEVGLIPPPPPLQAPSEKMLSAIKPVEKINLIMSTPKPRAMRNSFVCWDNWNFILAQPLTYFN